MVNAAIDAIGTLAMLFEGAGTGRAFRGKAPEFESGTVTESAFIRSAEKFLGKGAKEQSPGRYVSQDGLRQVRFGDHETQKPNNVHGHFESYDKSAFQGGKVTETAAVKITPDKP